MGSKWILIADDEPIIREVAREALAAHDHYEAVSAKDGKEALAKVRERFFDIVITDLRMPGLTGIELLEKIKEYAPETTVIVMTAHGTVEVAVDAMKKGAFDFLTKPFSVDHLEAVVERALNHRRIVQENAYLRSEISHEYNFGDIVGTSSAMKPVYEIVGKVAASDATVLIQGPSGTGKELVARALHQQSARKDGPFIKVNCAALAPNLLESELFGHEKGAFTGAAIQKPGRFELADNGTLLLDEISEMDIGLQAKLLRVLQEGEYDRVGGIKTQRCDVRIVATTNRDLRKEIAEGTFREDLYYRLNVIPVVMPPLCDREGDVELLTKHFLEKYARKNGRAVPAVGAKAMKALVAYRWPGNVRELENAMERAILLASAAELGENDFPMLGAMPTSATPVKTAKKKK